MTWKSRADKLPPPSFFAMVVAHLQKAYPGALITREVMTALRPALTVAWQNGRNAEGAAQVTCSCDGKQIVPSPAMGVQVPRGAVRAPKGAARGEVFGVEALRDPAQIERLTKKRFRVAQKGKQQADLAERWTALSSRAKKDTVKAEAQRRQAGAKERQAALLREAEAIDREIKKLRVELGRIEVQAQTQAQAPMPQTVVVEKTPVTLPKKARAKKANEAELTEKMVAAVQGLLPGLSEQLKAELNKEGGT